MATVADSIRIAALPAAVWAVYFEPSTWPAWVDQFAAVVSSSGYPEVGGDLVWRSGAAGRGEVSERVIEHQPQRLHRVEFSDPSAQGELATTFAAADGGTAVAIELTYELRAQGLFAKISDALFIRSQMRASLGRSLHGLKLEAEEFMPPGPSV
jgi:hypothetical protein